MKVWSLEHVVAACGEASIKDQKGGLIQCSTLPGTYRNVMTYAIGKGFHNLKGKDKTSGNLLYKELIEKVEPEDFSIVHKWRFMNLKKLFPYIPIGLNDILAHFTL